MLRCTLGRLPTARISPTFSSFHLRAAFSSVDEGQADLGMYRGGVSPEDRPFLHHGLRPRFRDYEKFRSPRKRASKLLLELNQEAVSQMKVAKPTVWETDFRVGDAVELEVVTQGGSKSDNTDKWRGVILGIFKKRLDTSILIRDVVFGEPIERRIPLHSPLIKSLKVLERNFVFKGKKKIKRAKLYYLSERNPMRKFSFLSKILCLATTATPNFCFLIIYFLHCSHSSHWE